MAEQVYPDQYQAPLFALHLPNRAKTNRESHEQYEREIGNWRETDDVRFLLAKKPLSIRQRLCSLSIERPPTCRLPNHHPADADPD